MAETAKLRVFVYRLWITFENCAVYQQLSVAKMWVYCGKHGDKRHKIVYNF